MRERTRLGLPCILVVCCGVTRAWAQAAPEAAEPAPAGEAAEPPAPTQAPEFDEAPATGEPPEPAAASAATPPAPSSLEAGPVEEFPAPPAERPEEITKVEWNPRWREAGFWDAVTVGVGAVIVIGDSQISAGESQGDWRKPILFDRSVRDLLRFDSSSGRSTAGTISDFMMLGSLAHNVLFDNLFVTWMLHGQPKLAWQMSVMNAEAYAIALSLTAVVKNVSSRARPLVQECEADPEYSPDCNTAARFRSFFSGHAATTAVGAGLLCAHHLNVPLYDNGPLDVGTCVMGIGLTMATGALRIASDNHWASDVVTGHLVGFASGLLVPTLLYYTDDDDVAEQSASGSESRALLLPAFGQDQAGLQLVGSFP